MEFIVYVTQSQPYTFDLTQLGYGASEPVPLYDIWQKQSLGTATGSLSTTVPSHGVRLLRLGDNVSGIESPATEQSQAQGKTAGASYNLAGQRVTNAYRGIVIRNGRKHLSR